jgi:hypothetical protein
MIPQFITSQHKEDGIIHWTTEAWVAIFFIKARDSTFFGLIPIGTIRSGAWRTDLVLWSLDTGEYAAKRETI